MPTFRTDINSRVGRVNFPSVNRQFAQVKRQPKMRGSFPKPVKWSIGEEGITNKRLDYNRALNLNKTAQKISVKNGYSENKKYAGTNYSRSVFDGNAARKLSYVSQPKISNKPVKNPQIKQRDLHSIKGAQKPRGVMQGAALSPMFVSMAKLFGVVVCFLAVICFVRVGLTAATVSQGIDSQQISAQLSEEQVKKNALEVQNSTLSNSGRIKQAAADYKLVSPAAMSTLTLSPDVLAYQGDKVSLVESLNRLAATKQ